MCQRVLVIIPAYNEADSIRNVIFSVRREFPVADILVVNDGSTDDTAHLAEEAGAILLSLPYNLGIGGAMQTGFKFAHEQGYDVAVQVDGDGQHDPAYIPVLLSLLSVNSSGRVAPPALVIGSRFVGPSLFRSSLARRAGIKWFAWLVSFLIGQDITDPTSGFRAVDRPVIEFFAAAYPQDYPEPESIIMAYRAGFRIYEVPVEMRERQGGKSSITPWRSAYYMIKVTLTILMGIFRPTFRRREL